MSATGEPDRSGTVMCVGGEASRVFIDVAGGGSPSPGAQVRTVKAMSFSPSTPLSSVTPAKSVLLESLGRFGRVHVQTVPAVVSAQVQSVEGTTAVKPPPLGVASAATTAGPRPARSSQSSASRPTPTPSFVTATDRISWIPATKTVPPIAGGVTTRFAGAGDR